MRACNINQTYIDYDEPWSGILAAAALVVTSTTNSLKGYILFQLVTVGVRKGDCMAPVLFLFMAMEFSKTLEKEWIKADLNMVNLRQHTHSPHNIGKLTGNKKKIF